MVIAHLITSLGCGGAENQMQQLVLASRKGQSRHIVISLTEGGLISSELKEVGVEVHSVGMKRGVWSPRGLFRLIRLLHRLKPDVLHCWLYHACLLGLFATRIVHVNALIWALRSANPGLHSYSMQTKAVVRLCARLSAVPDAIIVNSETARTVHEQWKYRTNRMKVVPNGIDADRFTPDPEVRVQVREEIGIAPDVMLVGLIARFHPAKDHETFLRAAGLLHQRHPDVHFLFAGQEMVPENHTLTRLIAENNLRQAVHLLGARRDIACVTTALDISCLSSWSESFPNVLLEAMACGVPCVTTDVGDCAFVVGDTGRIVPPKNPEALAAALDEMVSMQEFERTSLGQRARKRVLELFTLERMVSTYQKLYEDFFGQ